MEDDITISNEVLESIKIEYEQFLKQKDSIISNCKKFVKTIIDDVEKLELINVKNLISKVYTIDNNDKNMEICKVCKKEYKTKNGLLKHMKSHENNKIL